MANSLMENQKNLNTEQVREAYNQFRAASTVPDVLSSFQSLCDLFPRVDQPPRTFPTFFNDLYDTLIKHHSTRQVVEILRKRAVKLNYAVVDGRDKLVAKPEATCPDRKVLVVGGGPSGLRAAIEAQMLGCTVVVVEKRHVFSRNNIVYLWDYALLDMNSLGASIFYPTFSSKQVHTIGIRQLQLILLKVALLLGVNIHVGVTLMKLSEPTEECGFRAVIDPTGHLVSHYDFDVLIDASGNSCKMNVRSFDVDSPLGIKLKSTLRASADPTKNMIAMSANFVNFRTAAERSCKEIQGTSSVHNNMLTETLTDENNVPYKVQEILYYQRETHYILMTLTNSTLYKRKIFKSLQVEPGRTLVDSDNVNMPELEKMLMNVGRVCTNDTVQPLTFSKTSDGRNEVFIFQYQARAFAPHSCRILERKGRILLMATVGDSLMMPFWPGGHGISKGFLAAMDVCHVLQLSTTKSLSELISVKEEQYRWLKLVAEPAHLQKIKKNEFVSIDPQKRYMPSYNKKKQTTDLWLELYDTDMDDAYKEIVRNLLMPVGGIMPETKVLMEEEKKSVAPTEDKVAFVEETPKTNLHPAIRESKDLVLSWYSNLLVHLDIAIEDFTTSWQSGNALWGFISLCDKDFINLEELSEKDFVANNQRAIDVLEQRFGVAPILSADQISSGSEDNELSMLEYLTSIMQSVLFYYKQSSIDFFAKMKKVEKQKNKDVEKKVEEQEVSAGREASASLFTSVAPTVLSAVKWMSHIKHLRRSGSAPSMIAYFSADKICPCCETSTKMELALRDGPRVVHMKCFRCADCCCSLMGVRCVFDEVEHKYYCAKHSRATPGTSAEDVVTSQSDAASAVQEPIESKMIKIQSKHSKGAVATALKKLGKFFQSDATKVAADESQELQKSNSCPQLSENAPSDKCHFCQKHVYVTEKMSLSGKAFHRFCFKCESCSTRLTLKNYVFDRNIGEFLCIPHSRKRAKNEKVKKVEDVPEGSPTHTPVSRTESKTKLVKMAKKISNLFRMKNEKVEVMERINEDCAY